ncbi:MAG TPA: ACT domain-containing protein, partial [Anaerolineaceae bacterium]|nr:ACT domain-containing protein [Anaerolineaceae bacterium]HOG78721.1 ACT domain-containing protein [Anaerolineaceae bacterium]
WGETPRTYPVDIEIKAYDRQGLMAEISTILDNEGVNVRDIQMHIAHNLATIRIMVDVRDIAHLSRVLTRLENIPNVMEAHRTRPG